MRVKPFCVCRMATWLATQGVLGGSWTRLGSEAQWTSQITDALWPCGDWLEGGQRSAAAFVGRQTTGRCDLDRSWTRLGSEARWTKSDESDALRSCGDWLSRGPASSEARLRLSGGKPVDAATSTHAHRHLLMTIDIDGPSVQGAAGLEAELPLRAGLFLPFTCF